uniref:SCP domain-containing protein n=1 Tax=Mesocestoides corti TaxID=53468 RepID=A0A5K3FY54_MESCO
MSKTLICLLALVWCVASNAGEYVGLSEQERKSILTAHSSIRKSVNPTASNMLMLNYSVELEQQAAEYLKTCPLGKVNSAGAKATAVPGKTAYIDTSNTMTFEQIIAKFGEEKADYTYDSNTCKQDKTCMNYTQVVWAETNEVGCAKQECAIQNSESGGTGSGSFANGGDSAGGDTGVKTTQVVCYYTPAGNTEDAKPYKQGTSCSECPNNFKCEENQCVNSAPTMLSAVAVLISALLTTQCFA